MTRRIGIVILAIAATGLFFFLRDTEPTPEDAAEELVALLEQGDEEGFTRLLRQSAERNMNGEIDIEGVVQDDAGRPLAGVTIRFQEAHLALDAENASVKKGELVVDGEFELHCDDCSAIEADFSKDGFHETAREWFAFGPDVAQPGVVDHDAVVTLQARGTPARLEPFRGMLQIGGRTGVLPFSFGYGAGVMSPESVAERADAESVTEPLYIRLVVDTDADGTISIEQVSDPGMSYTIDKPRSPRLDFSTAKGGVIEYEPKERNVRLIEREMSLAPSAGYANTLAITRRDGRPQYFYCRIGNRYGRGTVDAARLAGSADPPPTAQATVAIELNAIPGDRNLTPRH